MWEHIKYALRNGYQYMFYRSFTVEWLDKVLFEYIRKGYAFAAELKD